MPEDISLDPQLIAAFKAFSEALGKGQKNDPPGTPVGPYLHGQQGLLNRRDRANPVISAMMSPMAGVADALPVYNGARNLDGGQFGGDDAGFESLITGQTAGALDTFANQPTTACADGPVGGLLKFCTLVNTFGNYTLSTREVQQFRAGRAVDRVDALTVQVINAMPSGLFATPTSTPSLANALNNELAARIWEAVISFQRMFAPRVFIGSPANNSGERRDIVGLDTHINTGNKVDATGMGVCTAANSDVKPFGNDLVNGSGRNIMQYIEMCDAFSMFNARRQGLGEPEYLIAMRPELWQEITEIIPIVKYERVIAVINRVTNGRALVDANGAYDERNAIRQSMLIPVNGRFIRVVVDDTIFEDNVTNSPLPAGRYASDIYGIPLTVLGGYPVTFWEYFDHGNNQANAIQQLAGGTLTFTTDGGMWRWFVNFKNGCLKLNAQFTPRLRLRTPQVAWRITDVAYQPLQHFRSWDPNSTYFADGGRTEGETNNFYTSWSPTTPVGV